MRAALMTRVRSRLRDASRLFNKGKDLQGPVSLKPGAAGSGNVLLSFLTEPFLLTPAEAGLYGSHPHYGASLEMARALLDLGYCVDVIRWNNSTFVPSKDYSIFIDARMNLSRLGPQLGPSCLKIMYIETAHWLFHMSAQYSRIQALQQRRGVALMPQKTLSPNSGIENADCGLCTGNEFSLSTYRFANRPLYRIPAISPIVCPWSEGKAFASCRKRFLWLGSGGLVHKGLDLVLEAFAAMPEYELFVCGPIDHERDFQQEYRRELYETPNIHTLGWVEASSPEFSDVANRCSAVVYASCSEGGGASVITCMHAGLIPIVNRESSVDIEDFGILLPSSSIEAIRDGVRAAASLPLADLESRARRAWEVAREKYTRERFSERFREVLKSLTTNGPGADPALQS